MFGSYMTEDHGEAQDMYIHGMRRAVSNIAWWACQDIPKVNLGLPNIPSDLSEQQFIQVLRAMQLEVEVNPSGVDQSSQSTETEEKKGRKFTSLFQRVEEQSELNGEDMMHTFGIKNVPRSTIKTKNTRLHETDGFTKLSIYPVGQLNTRSVSVSLQQEFHQYICNANHV